MPSDALKEHLQKRPEYRNTSKARLAYLYSDLSQARTTNPTSYTSSVAWWSNLIHDLVSQGLQSGGGEEQTDLDADQVTRGKSPSSKTSNDYSDKIIWHLDQAFVDRLRWEGAGRPTGLGTVTVSEGCASAATPECGLLSVSPSSARPDDDDPPLAQLQLAQATPPQLVPLSTFLSSTRPIEHFSWPRWILSNLVSAPLWWSLGKMGLTENGSGMSEAKSWQFAQGDWVMMETLKVRPTKGKKASRQRLRMSSRVLKRLFTTFTSVLESIRKFCSPVGWQDEHTRPSLHRSDLHGSLCRQAIAWRGQTDIAGSEGALKVSTEGQRNAGSRWRGESALVDHRLAASSGHSHAKLGTAVGGPRRPSKSSTRSTRSRRVFQKQTRVSFK